MKNHTILTDWSEDNCPVHDTEIRRIYTFGKYGDATVATFRGCGCAVCTNEASLQCGVALGHEVTYHTNYADAAGRATLIKMQESIANSPFA